MLGTNGWYVVVSPHIRTLQTLRYAIGDAAIEQLIRDKNIVITPLIAEIDDPLPTFEAVESATTLDQYKDERKYARNYWQRLFEALQGSPQEFYLSNVYSLVPWVGQIPAINVDWRGKTKGPRVWPKRLKYPDDIEYRLPRAQDFLYEQMQVAAQKGRHLLVVSHGNFLSELTGVKRPFQAEVSVHRIAQDGHTWWTERHVTRERLSPEFLRQHHASAIPTHACTYNSDCKHMACARVGSSPTCAIATDDTVGACACTEPKGARRRRASKRRRTK